jgi:hypothetical protein
MGWLRLLFMMVVRLVLLFVPLGLFDLGFGEFWFFDLPPEILLTS